MKYLFFDLEMANCDNGEGKICEFGYVVSDERLVVIDRGNHIINPNINRRQWDYYVVRKILTRKIDEYERKPLFSDYYNVIRKLISESDFVLGHSMAGDAKALCCECKRYGLPSIDFGFYDTKEIFKREMKCKTDVSVTGILKSLNVKVSGEVHDAEYDAYNTMLGLKAISAKAAKSVSDILKSNPESRDFCKDYEVNSIFVERQRKEKIFREIVSGKVPASFKIRSYEGRIFSAFCDNVRPTSKPNGKLSGRKVYVPLSHLERDFRESVNLAQIIRNHGGILVLTKPESDLVVHFAGREMQVKKSSEGSMEHHFKCGIGGSISFEGLLSALGVAKDDLRKDCAESMKCLLSDQAFISDKNIREFAKGAEYGRDDENRG